MSTIEQTQQSIPTGTWQADTVHSRVAFEVPYAVATFSGEVPEFEATLVDGQLTGVAKIASIQVKEENLQAHLLSPEFFDAERHPDVTFVSKKITRDGDSIEIEGELTIKGITKPATLSGLATGPAVDHFGAAHRLHRRRDPRAPRHHGADHGRPHRVRHQLEHAAPERRAGTEERGHPEG